MDLDALEATGMDVRKAEAEAPRFLQSLSSSIQSPAVVLLETRQLQASSTGRRADTVMTVVSHPLRVATKSCRGSDGWILPVIDERPAQDHSRLP